MPPPNPSSFTFLNKVSDWKPGMPYVLECFATWCGPCRAQIPHLAKLTKEYPNVFIVSVSNESEAEVRPFVEKTPDMRKYNVAVDTGKIAAQLQQKHSVRGIPHAFLFDAAGVLAWQGHPGEMDSELKKIAQNAQNGGFTGVGRKL